LRNIRGRVRWLWVPEANPREGFFEKTDGPNQHGSCVLTWAVSPKFGVAKRADVVIVKYEARPTLREYMIAIQKVVNDVREKGLQKKAVVNYSSSCK